jgi:hypothetical protein
MTLTTHPHLAPRLTVQQNYTSTPQLGLRGLFYAELYLTFTFIRVSMESAGGVFFAFVEVNMFL